MSKEFNKADWILHYIVGMAAGAVIGLAFLISGDQSGNIGYLSIPLVLGTTLLGGGFGSLLGDRLWLMGTYKTTPPNKVQHSAKSKFYSYASIATGFTLVAFTAATQLSVT